MTPKVPTPNFTISTDPMLANIEEVTDTKYELAFIYGFVGKVTDNSVRLYQGLDLRQFYKIPKDEIVYAEKATCCDGAGLTKLVLFSTTRITYVSRQGTATLPAGALADVVAAKNNEGEDDGPLGPCRPGCSLNGLCICAPVNYWFCLDKDTACKLGVEVLSRS
jgi:hypothetical protein